jgi:hypothetical protein
MAPPRTDISGGSIEDILNNIQTLQTTEQALITQLDTLTRTTGYDQAAATTLVTQINSIADARLAMFNTISANANIVQSGVAESRVDLVAQMTLYKVVEQQLNEAKAHLDTLNTRNDTKLRMVQINTYYGQRYEAQSNLMKIIILFCLPVLILFIIKKKGFIPETISNYLIGIIIAVGAIVILRNVWDILTRSNMDFNSYNWDYQWSDPKDHIPSIWDYNKQNMFNFGALFQNLMGNLGLCIDDKCCAPGTYYDKAKGQCFAPSPKMSANSIAAAAAAKKTAADATATATKAGFTTRAGSVGAQGFTSGGNLEGTVIASYVNDRKNTQNGIAPFSYQMDYASV